jgi:outer membrane protein assembly factor BamB
MRAPALLLILALSAPATAGDWPAFRGGPLGGVPAKAPSLPDKWDAKTNIKWSVALPAGWSSPIVSGGRVFVTSATSSDKQPESRKGLYITDLNGKTPAGTHTWAVICLDADSGKVLWRKEAFKGKLNSSLHIKNSLASETPVTDGERIYSVFGNVGIVCHDRDGKELWKKKFTPRKMQMGWGTGSSPAVVDGKVIVVNDNEESSYIEALDGKTGKPLWKVKRAETSNWATPFVWKNAKRTEIITAGKGRVRSYDINGNQLWELRGMSILCIPTPFAAGDLLYVSSGYVLDPFIKPVYAIKAGAKGDISLKGDKTSNDHIVWCQKQAGAYHPTPVVLGGYLYVLYDRGFLSCFEAKTGKPVYRNKRLGGASFTASPWAYGDRVYCLSEDGETWVVKAGPEFEIVGRNKLGDMALASPAVADGSLFIRTKTKLWCVRK